MRHLPTGAEQEWLVESLAELIRRQGHEPFLLNPIVEPNRRHFPEASGPAAYILDRATRRMLQYAGMGDLEVCFERFREEHDPHRDGGRGTTAAYFRGIEDGCCFFGLNIAGSADAEYLAGVMCHEIAHAYRRRHRLESGDGDEEELLTDLTTVYLGFGILSVNNSWRYRAAGDAAVLEWSTSSTGYLTPQAMAFLLALQVWARESRSRQRKRIANLLEANQATFVGQALDFIEKHSHTFTSRLDLPGRTSGSVARGLEEILQPLPEYRPWADQEPESEATRDLPNAGLPVFRVPGSKALAYTVAGLSAGGVVGWLLAVISENLWLFVPAFFAGGVAGWIIGRGVFDACSDPECKTRIPGDMDTCPECGGVVRGRIPNRDARLEAEEQLAEGKEWVDLCAK